MTQGRLDLGSQRVYYSPDPMHLPKVDWTPPRVQDLPSWRDAKRVGIDVECRDPDLKTLGPGCRRPGNYVCGVSFAIEDGEAHYLPIRHEGGDNCDIGKVLEYLRDQLTYFTGFLVGAKLEFDLDWLATELGDIVLRQRVMDVQIADVLIDELQMKYNLEELCKRYGLPGKDEVVLRQAAATYRCDPKKDLWRLPGRYVAQYGAVDARRPLQVLRRQELKIDSEGVGDIWALEQKVTPILVKMRRRGVRVDIPKLDGIDRMSARIEAECLAEVHGATGVKIKLGDVWKPEVLAHTLRSLGYTIPKTERKISEKTGKPVGGKDSVDKIFLAKCGKVGALLLKAREWNKLRTTFVKQVRQQLIGDRVHCTFNQLKATDENQDREGEAEGKGVRYGRLSSSNFNFQQQPVRHDDFGEMWRSVFIADEGARWACSDWSQQEPRIGVHYAEILKLPGAKEFADEYRRNPKLDIHQKLADLTSIVRKIVKNYVNGRLYGMGDVKLCGHINLPTEWKMIRGERRLCAGPAAQSIIDQFNAFAPWIRGLTRAAANVANERGYVWTILRRKCRFLRGPDGKYMYTHKAFNRIGQGGAADQMKATLVECDREGIPIQAVVHDEFDWSFTDIAEVRRVKELQITTVKFSVPMNCDSEIGDNWGELTKIDQVAA